jgi:N-acetylneuraminic acid mutarotase
MKHKNLVSQMIGSTLLVLLLAACASSQPPSTSIPPTSTPAPPTSTPVPPTSTPIPPTATLEPTATPTEIANQKPPPMGYAWMAYDKESDRTILFGGAIGYEQYDLNAVSGETWAYDGSANRWSLMNPASGPSARGGVAMAYDSESDRIILQGGVSTGYPLSDTWAYDYNTNTWTEMAKGPGSRFGARMAYDVESDRIVLFGGYELSGRFFNDTRVYDYNSDTWTDMKPSTSPPGRNYHAMAYDSESDRVIVWGKGEKSDDSVWAYDFNTNTWEEMKPGQGPAPLLRIYSAMVYDAALDRMILFGGSPDGNETWSYDYNTNTWTKLEPETVPYKATRHALVYSDVQDSVILFGGARGAADTGYTGEIWIYDPNANTWTNMTTTETN